MSDESFCAACGDKGDRAFTVHCDSCGKLVTTGRVGAVCPHVDDVRHATVQVRIDHAWELTVCADCIHKLGQPFVEKLIEMGTRKQKGSETCTLSLLALELIRLEERRLGPRADTVDANFDGPSVPPRFSE